MIVRAPLTISLLAYVLIVLTVCNPEVSSIVPFRFSRMRNVPRTLGLRKPRSTMREEQDRAFWPARTWGTPRTLLLQKDKDVVDVEDVETKSNLAERSKTCVSDCDPGGSLTLTRELLPELLQEAAHYMRVTQIVILTYNNSQELCVAVARSLYLRGLSPTCVRSATIAGSHPAIVLLTHQEDGGGEVSEELRRVSQAVSVGKVVTPHLVVVLHAHTRLLLPLSHRLHLCVLQPKGDAVDVREVFTFGSGSTGRPTEDVVGTWRPGVPNHFLDRSTAIVPRDFQGNTLRFAVMQVAPYVILKKEANGTLRPSGYLVDLVHILQQQLNFTIRWVEAVDQEFGVPTANDSWTGLVGILKRQAADVAIAALSFTTHRSKVIDYSPPVDFLNNQLLIYLDANTEFMDWNTYIMGFHWSVWATMVGVWALMSLGLVKVAKPTVQGSLYNYLFSFAGAYSQQGCEVVPACLRGRMVFFSFWIGSVLLYYSYTARLTSQLAVVYTAQPFNTLTDALTKAGYSIAVQKGTSYITTIESSRDQAMQLLYKQLLENPYLRVRDDLQALSLLQDTRRKIAYFQSVNTVNYMIRGNCSYMWLGAEYFKEYGHLGYQKNLSFASTLSYYVVKAWDTGILKKLRSKWWGKETSCTSTASFHQLGFSKTISAFIVLAIGAALGVLILLLEVSLYYLRPCGPVKKLIEGECLATRRKQRRRRGFRRQRLRVFY